jgi:hypothetical protein
MTKATTAANAKSLVATRPFKDAGTGRSFEGGKPVEDLDEGTLGNYRAAGLVGEPEDAKSADKPGDDA